MIPNPAENKYRLYAFLAITVRILLGIVAYFNHDKITSKTLKVTPLCIRLLCRKRFSVGERHLETLAWASEDSIPPAEWCSRSPGFHFGHISEMVEH